MTLSGASPSDPQDVGLLVSRQKGDRMLLAGTVLLVLAGLVLLLLGFANDSLGLVYLSIGCTAVAGVTLTVFSRQSRRRAIRLATDRDSPHWPDPAAAAEGLSTDQAPLGPGREAEQPTEDADRPDPNGDQVPLDDA
jgi:hypothetical protein